MIALPPPNRRYVLAVTGPNFNGLFPGSSLRVFNSDFALGDKGVRQGGESGLLGRIFA